MWFSKPKPPVDIDEFEWLLVCFAWIHRNLEDNDARDGFQPSLARHDSPGIAQAQGATDLFLAIKSIAGLDSWDCELRQGDPVPDLAGSGLVIEQRSKRALGTFSVETTSPAPRYDQFGALIEGTDGSLGGDPVIHYAPDLLGYPEALTATLAHELAHLLGYTLDLPPGGEELEEHATDCIAVYLGFGVFLANSARHFSQFSDGQIQGWKSSTSGYLSEQALVTLTAMFVRLFGIAPELASAPLKPYLRTDFGKALKYLDREYPDLPEALASVDLKQWA